MDVERLIDEDHCARGIWGLTGRLDLSRYHAEIAAVEGRARLTIQRHSCLSACGYTPIAKGLAQHVRLRAGVPFSLVLSGFADCSR